MNAIVAHATSSTTNDTLGVVGAALLVGVLIGKRNAYVSAYR
jgi:hypothetical protein